MTPPRILKMTPMSQNATTMMPIHNKRLSNWLPSQQFYGTIPLTQNALNMQASFLV
jgi:hypothetical protein